MVESAAGLCHVGDHKVNGILDALFLLFRIQGNGHEAAAEAGVAAEGFHLVEEQNVFDAGFEGGVSGGKSGKAASDDNEVMNFIERLKV